MSQAQREDYLSLRREFEPTSVKLVIVAESPPANGTYFYNPTGKVTEWLFAALMKQLGSKPTTKEEGLREFQRMGWVLVDATYQPINKLTSNAAKDKMIDRDFPLLRDDLESLLRDRSTPLVLVKANVCRLLEHKLTGCGFNVLNKGRVVYFPSHGRQPDFHRQFRAILKSAKASKDRSGTSLPKRQKRPANFIGKIRAFIQPIADNVRAHLNFEDPGWKRFVEEAEREFARGNNRENYEDETTNQMQQSHAPTWEQHYVSQMQQRYASATRQRYVSAVEIADYFGLDPKAYRAALRRRATYDRRLSWHAHNSRWTVLWGSPAHDAMHEVAERLAGQG